MICLGLIDSEKRKLKSAKTTCGIMTFTGVKTLPFALSLVPIFLPRLPINLFAMPPLTIIDCNLKQYLSRVDSLPKWATYLIQTLFVFGSNYWYYTLIFGTGIMLTNIMIIVPTCLTVSLGVFQRNFIKIFKAQTDSKIATDNINRVVNQYREVQILCGYFNEAHKNCVVMLLICTIGGQVINVAGLLSDASDVGSLGVKASETQHLLLAQAAAYFFKISNIEGLILCVSCINFIFGFCAGVHCTSSKCLKAFKNSEKFQKNKLLKQLVRSMPPVKVKCGSDNFMEKITPVVYQQFSNEKIMESLLLRRK